MPRDIHLRHLFPFLSLNVEAIDTVEDSSLVQAPSHKNKLLLLHTANGKVTPVRTHWCLLCGSETLLVDPATALGGTLTHLEEFFANLNRLPALVYTCRLVAIDLFSVSGGSSIAGNIDYLTVV